MKKERKELLMHSFPAATADQMSKMEGKGAANYIIFLTRGAEVFARGYLQENKIESCIIYCRSGITDILTVISSSDSAMCLQKTEQ